MGILTAEAFLVGLAGQASSPDDLLYLERLRFAVASLSSGVWLVFSLSFGRPEYRDYVRRWKWVVVASFFFPFAFAVPFIDELLIGPIGNFSSNLHLRLGWSGEALLIVSLIVTVIILMNLERTLRNSTGHARYQIKFMVLGLACFLGTRIYIYSDTLLFRSFNVNHDVVYAFSLALATAMICVSLARTRIFDFDLYLSRSLLYNSLTGLVVGIYFLVVGIVAKLVHYFNLPLNFPIATLIVMVAFALLVALWLSEDLRYMRKRFVLRHFRRPTYDYQQVWAGFTENTSSITDVKDLCMAITSLVSHTLGAPFVSLWIVDKEQEHLSLRFSTLQSSTIETSELSSDAARHLIKLMEMRSIPVDLYSSADEPVRTFVGAHDEKLRVAGIRYSVPVRGGGKLIALMTLRGKMRDESLSFEDLELLRTVAAQSGAALLNLQLTDKVREAEALEAFQVMSAFFMHDLKNLASKISLVTQNMPLYFHDEEFRHDAIHTMSQSVDKIKKMCSRLSLLSEKLRLNPHKRDLNELVRSTLLEMNGQLKANVKLELEDLPKVYIDSEQMQKVIVNLLINANEATDANGQVRIGSACRDGWVELFVYDNGCGISREFIDKFLFKPFQTTKKQGMGIGLFHCKTIVEAHDGKIEVESQEGKGSRFRVLLPVIPAIKE